MHHIWYQLLFTRGIDVKCFIFWIHTKSTVWLEHCVDGSRVNGQLRSQGSGILDFNFFFLNFINILLIYTYIYIHIHIHMFTKCNGVCPGRGKFPANNWISFFFCPFLSCSTYGDLYYIFCRHLEMILVWNVVHILHMPNKGLNTRALNSKECLQNVSNTSLLMQCSQCHLGKKKNRNYCRFLL